MDKITIERSQPVQGRPVHTRWKHGQEVLGEMTLPFHLWIKLNKLIQKGNEKIQLEGPEAAEASVKVQVVGYQLLEAPASAAPPPQVAGSFGGISNLARDEDEDDPDIRAAEAAAKQEKQISSLTRTLNTEAE